MLAAHSVVGGACAAIIAAATAAVSMQSSKTLHHSSSSPFPPTNLFLPHFLAFGTHCPGGQNFCIYLWIHLKAKMNPNPSSVSKTVLLASSNSLRVQSHLYILSYICTIGLPQSRFIVLRLQVLRSCERHSSAFQDGPWCRPLGCECRSGPHSD